MLGDAKRRKFDVVMAWAIDRRDLFGRDLFLEQQAVDATTPAGKLMFQV
jgi:hypothetical protein